MSRSGSDGHRAATSALRLGCFSKGRANRRANSRDRRSTASIFEAKLNLRNLKKHTHTKTKKKERGPYGLTDGLEDTVNEAGLFWQG